MEKRGECVFFRGKRVDFSIQRAGFTTKKG